MQGYLLKKKEKLGKWKQLYFVLRQDGADSQLTFYEHPKRTKPKGLIDLSCAFLYTVHESYFDKRHCFQLVEKALPCLATVTYLGKKTKFVNRICLNIEEFFERKMRICLYFEGISVAIYLKFVYVCVHFLFVYIFICLHF